MNTMYIQSRCTQVLESLVCQSKIQNGQYFDLDFSVYFCVSYKFRTMYNDPKGWSIGQAVEFIFYDGFFQLWPNIQTGWVLKLITWIHVLFCKSLFMFNFPTMLSSPQPIISFSFSWSFLYNLRILYYKQMM